MEFGYHHSSFATHDDRSPAAALVDRAQRLEDDGFEWLSLMDHLWQLPFHGHRDEAFVECYSGLSAVAAVTDEITLSALVTCVHYRNPVYLAKVVSSLDALSEGRAVLGIGAAGTKTSTTHGYGIPAGRRADSATSGRDPAL